MTPSELADRLESIVTDRQPQRAYVSMQTAAAMLREAERLLRENYRRDADWVIARHNWLEGRTP